MTTRRVESLIGLVMLIFVASSLEGQTPEQLAAGYDGPVRNDDDGGRPRQGNAGMDAGMDPRTGQPAPPRPTKPTVSPTTLPRNPGDVDRVPDRMPGH